MKINLWSTQIPRTQKAVNPLRFLVLACFLEITFLVGAYAQGSTLKKHLNNASTISLHEIKELLNGDEVKGYMDVRGYHSPDTDFKDDLITARAVVGWNILQQIKNGSIVSKNDQVFLSPYLNLYSNELAGITNPEVWVRCLFEKLKEREEELAQEEKRVCEQIRNSFSENKKTQYVNQLKHITAELELLRRSKEVQNTLKVKIEYAQVGVVEKNGTWRNPPPRP